MQPTTRRLFAASVLALSAALVVPASAQQPASGKIELLWLGQSATRLKTVAGKVIVIDPWLTGNPKTPQEYKNLDALGKVDIILVTHGHGDHLGDAPALSKKNNAPMWAPAGLNQSLQTLGVMTPELSPRMGKGGTIKPFPGVKITAVHAEHSSELLWRNPATDKNETHVGGEPVGYIIELENGFKIYHMGDTGVFGDMKYIGEHFKPDLVMVPIGGHFVMSPEDAAYATREIIKPKYAIPMHYGTNPYLVGTPEEYMKAMGDSPVKVFPMKPGDKLEF